MSTTEGEKINPVTRNDCKVCGGIHFGSGTLCPYRCDKCGHQVGPCEQTNCARDARWAQEKAESDKWTLAGGLTDNPTRPDSPATLRAVAAELEQSPGNHATRQILVAHLRDCAAQWEHERKTLKEGQ